jgi:hypothetical protein
MAIDLVLSYGNADNNDFSAFMCTSRVPGPFTRHQYYFPRWNTGTSASMIFVVLGMLSYFDFFNLGKE